LAAAAGITVAVAALATPAQAQSPKPNARVGVLSPFAEGDPGFEAFRAGLEELGYLKDKNLTFEIRWAEGRLDRLPQLAAELAPLKLDVILVGGEQGLLALKAATVTTLTPIVTVVCDPLDRLVQSISKPGGSATGLTCVHADLAGKRIEKLKELMPTLGTVAVLYNRTDPTKGLEYKETEAAAAKLGIRAVEFTLADVDGVAGLERAFDAIAAQRPQAVMVLVDAFMIFHRQKIAELALARRLPSAFGFKEFVEAGGLLSYGANRSLIWKGAAKYADEIIRGAKAGDLPIQQPTVFELYVNGKTASALGIAIPRTLELQAAAVVN
jgi:putative ABC transport system substrate-binding protein